MSDAAVEIQQMSKRYGRFQALEDVSLSVPAGSVFGLLGPNGAGKSTLVKALLKIIRPTVCNGQLLGMPIGHRATLQKVGYLPESVNFPDYLTGRQVILHTAGMAKVPSKAAAQRAGELLERTGMTAAAERRISTYSKGMKQRIGLAQALVNDPELLVLDEPTDGVDPEGRIEIRRLIQSMRDEGRTVFLNSHLLGEMEQMADEIAILAKGKMVTQGNLQELMSAGRKFEVCMVGPVPPIERQKYTEAGHVVTGDRIELDVEGPQEVQQVLDELRQGGHVIRRVAEVTQSLEQIFMSHLKEDAKGGAR